MAKPPVIYDHNGQPVRRLMMSGFDAASAGRRTANWHASGAGINSLLAGSLSVMRSRVRDQARNVPWVHRAIRSYVANLVGTGIRPISKAKDDAFRRQINELWDDWVISADADGRLDFYGMQSLAVRSIRTSGEILIRKHYKPTDRYDLPVPFQIQLIESDHLDHSYTMEIDDGGRIIQGVEFNADNERVAYHIFERHPQEIASGFAGARRLRIPADQIIHVFEPERPGQVRGYPGMVSTVLRMLDMMEYEDAEVVRKKLAAMLVGFITSPIDDSQMGPGPLGEEDEYGSAAPVATLESGTIQKLDPGQEVNFNEPADVGGSYEAFMKMNLRAGAAGADVMYEQMTGDYAGVTFSSIRAGLNDVQRIWEQVQHNVLIHQMCRPVRDEFVRWAVKSGRVDLPSDYAQNPYPYHRADWVAPGWPYVNPVDDAKADVIRMRAGTESRASIVAARGRDIETLDLEIAADNKRADGLDLKFDSDPRKTTSYGQDPGGGGIAQKDATGEDGDNDE